VRSRPSGKQWIVPPDTEAVQPVDAKARHVDLAAVAVRADAIVTFNMKDFAADYARLLTLLAICLGPSAEPRAVRKIEGLSHGRARPLARARAAPDPACGSPNGPRRGVAPIFRTG